MTLDDDGLPDKGEMIQYFRIRVDEYREIKGRHQNGDFMTSNECKLIQSWSKDCERLCCSWVQCGPLACVWQSVKGV